MINKKVIVRAHSAEAFFGTLVEETNEYVLLKDFRKIHYRSGATDVEQIAMEGVKGPNGHRLTMVVASGKVIDHCQIIPCTKKAIKSIEGAPVWKASESYKCDGQGDEIATGADTWINHPERTFFEGRAGDDARGSGLAEYNGKTVYEVDGIDTLIVSVHGNVAKGYIVLFDLTLSSCYIEKSAGNFFAHGRTLRGARDEVIGKLLRSKHVNEMVRRFKEKFKNHEDKYLGHEFATWYKILTGASRMGVDLFIKENEMDLNKYYTVKEFMNLCRDRYGWNIIKRINGGGL